MFSVILTRPASVYSTKLIDKLAEEMKEYLTVKTRGKTREKIIRLMKENNEITIAELA